MVGKMDKETRIFERYKQIARVLGQMFSPMLEVALHDLRTPKKAIIALENGHVSNRKLGDSTTDLGIRRIEKGDVPDELVSYRNTTSSGRRLKSSSIAIRNDKGKLIGSLCLNLALDGIADCRQILDTMMACTDQVSEQLTPFIQSDLSVVSKVRDNLAGKGKTGRALTAKERKNLLKQLVEQGVLQTRSAITIVSKELGISRPTIYSDLKEIYGKNL